jgi:hypothetical protein
MVNIADSRTIVCSDFKDFLEYFKPTNPFEQFRDGYLCTMKQDLTWGLKHQKYIFEYSILISACGQIKIPHFSTLKNAGYNTITSSFY